MTRRLTKVSATLPLLVLVACAETDAAEQHKDLVRRFVEAGNARDFAALDSLVTDDFTRHSQATPDVVVQNRDQFRTFLRQDSVTFPDSRVTMQQLVAEDDLVAFHANYVGTQQGAMGPFPASGRQMDVEFFGVFRIEDDRIAELWLTWDNLSALAQLGHWPPAPGNDSAGPR